MNPDLRDLYQQLILDHSRHPRNQGRLEGPGCQHAHGDNPACGDEVDVWVQFRPDGGIEDIRFQGQGCAISQASASMMSVRLKGLDSARLRTLMQDFHHIVTGSGPVQDAEALGDLAAFEGVQKFPQRIKCATLAWHAVEQALKQAGG